MKTITDFIESYYPNYYSCSDIAYNNDLCKLTEQNSHECNNSMEIYQEIETELTEKNGITPEYFEVIEVAELRFQISNLEIYEKAILGYINNK